jgi:hypothetical protein
MPHVRLQQAQVLLAPTVFEGKSILAGQVPEAPCHPASSPIGKRNSMQVRYMRAHIPPTPQQRCPEIGPSTHTKLRCRATPFSSQPQEEQGGVRGGENAARGDRPGQCTRHHLSTACRHVCGNIDVCTLVSSCPTITKYPQKCSSQAATQTSMCPQPTPAHLWHTRSRSSSSMPCRMPRVYEAAVCVQPVNGEGRECTHTHRHQQGNHSCVYAITGYPAVISNMWHLQ